MKQSRFFAAVLGLAAACTMLNADTWNKKTKLTFSGPVQVPGPNTENGVVTLPAGTYVFKLVESSSNRHVVEVTNERENKVYSTILAIPDYRVNATSETVMYFSERMSGAPMAVKAWFYPGDNFGQRVVYPKVKAAQIAAVVNQPVPSHSVEVIERTKIVQVPVYIQTPAKQEVAYAPATFEKHDATDTAGTGGEVVKAAASEKQLPKTASSIQLVGVMGLFILAVSLLTRRIAHNLQ